MMTEYRFELPFRPNDNVVLLVSNGKMAGIAAPSEKYARSHADKIHELMILVMKQPNTKSGVWIFRISDNWKTVYGELIATKEEK
jgi:hypothetical protein